MPDTLDAVEIEVPLEDEETEEPEKCCECDHEVGDECGQRDKIERGSDIYCQECYDEQWVTCDRCDDETDRDNASCVGDDWICDYCIRNHYAMCERCCEYERDGDVIDIEGRGSVCQHCYESGEYDNCHSCGNHFRSEDGSYSERNDRWYCNDCYPDEEKNTGSVCDEQHVEFEIPVSSAMKKELKTSSIRHDTKTLLTMGGSRVDDAGIGKINSFLYAIPQVFSMPGDWDWRWQTKQGNITKRIAKHVWETYKVRLTPAQVSEVGNIAKRHCVTQKHYGLNFTRHMNMPREEFYNDGSCWWSNYSESRCLFKENGGIGMRFYGIDEPEPDSEQPALFPTITNDLTGRAWLVPVIIEAPEGSEKLVETTHETAKANGYIVFNGYGIETIEAARVMAHLIGGSYERVQLHNYGCSDSSIYINSSRDSKDNCVKTQSYFVATPELLDGIDSIDLQWDRTCDCAHND